MKARFYVFFVIVVALPAMTVNVASAQTTKIKNAPEAVLAALQPGLAVKMQGLMQKDSSVLCTDIKTLPADLAEDNWEIIAAAHKIDPENREFMLLQVPIKLQPTAKFKDESGGAFQSFADLKTGMLVEVRGTYLKDGTFLCKKVENVSSKLMAKPGKQNEVEIKGKIEKIDTASRTVRVAGVTFNIVTETEFKTALK
jgi:hypothetical protein